MVSGRLDLEREPRSGATRGEQQADRVGSARLIGEGEEWLGDALVPRQGSGLRAQIEKIPACVL